MTFLMFTSPDCKHCQTAKVRLHSRGHQVVEVDVTRNPGALAHMQHKDFSTVPQIYRLDEWAHIGGNEELTMFLR